MIANYHTHTFRCGHAIGKEEDYIKTAIANNIKIMGFSDHAPFMFPDGYQSPHRVKCEQTEDYFSTIRALREKYKGKIEIYIGFEMEYYPLYFNDMLSYVKQAGAEYLILGQHFIDNEHPIGNPAHVIVPSGDDKLVEYVNCVIAAMKTGEFLYVAHPDMFLHNGTSECYNREMQRLCQTAKELDIPLEMNFLGIYGHRNYPNNDFWKIAAETGTKVIFGLDAHNPERAYDAQSLIKANQLVEKYKLNLIDKLNIK